MQIEELLNRLPLSELKNIAYFNNLPEKGVKRELISVILTAGLSPQRILEFVSIGSLKQILADEGLPRTGKKKELIARLLTICRKAAGEKRASTYDKGHQFEDRVASWAKEEFKEFNPRTRTRVLVNGLSVKRPYEVDVHVQCKGRGLFAQSADIWIECKWKEKTSVKRTDIMKLVSKAQDVYQAAKAGREELYYNGLMLVSNQRFDVDALNYANQLGVLCVRFDGEKYEEQNNPRDWVGEPPWLKQVMC